MLAGAIHFSTPSSSAEVAERIARNSARYPGERARCFHSDFCISLYRIERHGRDFALPAWGDGDKMNWIVSDSDNHNADRALPSRNQHCDRSVLIEVDLKAPTLRLTVDRVGVLWLYLAKTAAGYIFSTEFSALVKELRGTLSVDTDSVLLELALGYTPDDKTVFQQIQLVPPGQTIELSKSGASVVAKQELVYGDYSAALSTAQKFDKLDQIYSSIYDRYLKPVATDLVLSVSAGYDSRYALAVMDSNAMRLPLCTFGNPDSDEVRNAQAVVSRIGRRTDVFPIAETDWNQWKRCIQSLGNSGMTQWAGWAESWLSFLAERGRQPIIGYLGDALSGKHLGAELEQSDWVRFWINWSAESGWAKTPLLDESVRQRLSRVMVERFQHCVGDGHFAFPHQRAMHLDLYGRQRRWVASQPNLISRYLTPVLFFYDGDLIDFWTHLGPKDLISQRLYLAYAHTRFPRLFPKKEGSEPTTLLRAARKISRILTGADGRVTPLVIDNRRVIIENLDKIIQLTKRVAPVLEPVIDTNRFCDNIRHFGGGTEVASASMIVRAVNVMFLLELAL